MKVTGKQASLRALIALLALGLVPVAHAQIKIGFMATLSGPAAAIGQDMYDAFMLGIEHSGGRLGGQAVQVLREDDQLKPDLAVQIVQKLIEKERVPIIAGLTFSNVLMAVLKPIVDKEVFLIETNAGPAPVAGKLCSPYFFSTSLQNDNDSEGMGKYARDKGYKRVVLMAPNYQAGKDLLAGFKRYYKGEVIDEVYTQLNQPDYQSEIAQLQVKKPDAVFVFYPGGMGVNFVKQYQQSGLLGKLPLLSASTIDGTTLPALGESAIGMVTVGHWGPDFDNAQSRKFVEDFEKKFNRVPSKYASQSYDGALLLDAALRKTKGNVTDKKALQAALKSADYKSVRGAFKFNNNNFPIQDYYLIEVGRDTRNRVNLITRAKVLSDHQDAYHSDCPMK
ncbi:MAG: ABC transporter substrate-binding protein [Betaproteobacteria bacterium]|nr:ABC transporter substrate-binding protein [Betaproteobacteria bacterium]